ncbi:MAG: hypothetical protein AAF206_12930 [Bacteroidota bacterium]
MKYPLILLTAMILTSNLSAQSPAKACACCTEAQTQFHFWVGDWKAYTPNGKLAGTNRIVLLEDSCVMQENWTSANGKYTGTSYNFYDKLSKQWRQTWIDNQGGHLLLFGGMEDGNMVLFSEPTPDGKGNLVINRITWTPNDDGTVRQHWEVSKDDKKTWQTAFDGLYKKA